MAAQLSHPTIVPVYRADDIGGFAFFVMGYVDPEHILLERSTGRAIVTDFGIARADFNPSLTADGHVLGTVHYMSPEQSRGQPLDGRSDMYSLGCVGFFALSGRLPFEGQSPQAILIAHATKEAPSLRSIAPTVPSAQASVIDRCLRKSPDDRYSNGLRAAIPAAHAEARTGIAGRVRAGAFTASCYMAT